MSGRDILYFLDHKMHFPPQIWEENGGASYSPKVAYLAHWGVCEWSGVTGGRSRTTCFASNFFPLFSSSKT